MSATQLPAASAAPVDRSVRLIVLGGCQVILGCLAAMISAFTVSIIVGGGFPQVPAEAQGAIDTRPMIPGVVVYLQLAIGFIWIGVGMIRIRRWAWTLTLVLAWIGLIAGLLSVVMVQIVMGQKSWAAIAEQSKLPPQTAQIMWITTTLTTFVIYVILPTFFVMMCQPKAVRDTVYRHDPTPRWTDRCPMSVLAISIMLVLSALQTPVLAAFNWMFPVFGVLLSGPAGAAVICSLIVCLALLAWGNYRLKPLAWWGTLLIGFASGLNWTLVSWRGGIMQMYEKMGLPPDQLELIRKTGMPETLARITPWTTLATGVAFLGYMLYVRPYFVAKSDIANATS
jgi:hypothetical protein